MSQNFLYSAVSRIFTIHICSTRKDQKKIQKVKKTEEEKKLGVPLLLVNTVVAVLILCH